MISKEEMNRLAELGSNIDSSRRGEYLSVSGLRSESISRNAQVLIDSYSGPLSRMVNDGLRGDYHERSDFLILFEHLFNKALNELPAYGNKTVFRMDNPGIEFQIIKNWYKKRLKKVISFPNFLSTSKNRWSDGEIIFKISTIFCGSARDISRYSNKTNENEVLFLSRSKFKIIDVNEKEEYIELKEVNRDYSNVIVMNDNVYINDHEIEKLLDLDDSEGFDLGLSLSDQGLL